MELNKHSSTITQDDSLPAAQAMLHAIGLSSADLKKPQIGIVSTGYEGNPCNMHLNDLAVEVKKGTEKVDLIGLIFNTIGVSDGISNGTPGMRYSLPSREIIADSIETVVNAQCYDGLVAVVGCDKNMPGAMMAMARLNRPAILVYGGSIASGCYKKEKLNIVSAFEAYGKKLAGTITPEDYKGVVQNACPGAGACGGMYTANTMSSAIEALGMSLPGSSSNPAVNNVKNEECVLAGESLQLLLEKDIKPLDIMTKKAFENALTVVMAMGGSTNAVLHFLAIAKTAGIELDLNDFQRISDKTPFIADLKPSGKYLMEDVFTVGGVPAVMKYLLKEGLIHGDCLTVTGKTVAENLANIKDLDFENQDVILPTSKAIKPTAHIQILFGNLAENGAVAKITGKEGERFEGTAKVFNSEIAANEGILAGKVKKGNVVVIRFEGPKGAPGMPEMLKPTSSIMGAGLGNDVALITDGRFSGGSHGFVVGHVTPEAQEGGLIGLIKDGDNIIIDAVNNTIDVSLSDEEITARKAAWKAPDLKVKSGYLWKYAKTVSSASNGCLTDRN